MMGIQRRKVGQPMQDDPIPLKEAAEQLNVKVERLRRAAWDKRLVAERRGRDWLVRPSEVRRYLREGGHAPMSAPTRSRQEAAAPAMGDRKSTRLNSSHANISYAVFCLKKKKTSH